ncbi:hypothetical protein, partial [Roseburia inulinivorans]|uniref:hypothetical protein n=1 Tax=Roseburia inulinivorans TaxID=360807 RepID=UPI003AB1A984
ANIKRNGVHRKMPALQKEMQASSTSNFRYFTCLLDKGHIRSLGGLPVRGTLDSPLMSACD